jgi:1-acyl-sn-glycerol-3-phosphate acyltransferase
MFCNLIKLIRYLIAWLDMALTTAFLYLLSYLPPAYTHVWYPKLFRHWCWVFVRALGVELKLHQKNEHPLPEHFILIGNHPSAFEDIGMPALFNARFLAKEQVKDWWILGRISQAAGTLYVKREAKQSRKQAGEALIQTLLEGHNIALYPEGGCKGRRLFLPFRYGCFEAAIKTGIPIIPVFLHYEAQESFEWLDNQTLLQKIWTILKSPNKTANYYVFDAILPKQFENKESLCDYVEHLYLKWQTQYLE